MAPHLEQPSGYFYLVHQLSLKHQQLPRSLYHPISVKTIKSLKLKTLDSTLISLSLPPHILHWSLLSFSFLPPEPKLYLPHHLTAIDSILSASSRVCTPPFSLPFASPPAINIFISIRGFRWLLEDVFGLFFFKPPFSLLLHC